MNVKKKKEVKILSIVVSYTSNNNILYMCVYVELRPRPQGSNQHVKAYDLDMVGITFLD